MEEKLLALGKWAGAVITVGGVLLLGAFCLRPILFVVLPFVLAFIVSTMPPYSVPSI